MWDYEGGCFGLNIAVRPNFFPRLSLGLPHRDEVFHPHPNIDKEPLWIGAIEQHVSR